MMNQQPPAEFQTGCITLTETETQLQVRQRCRRNWSTSCADGLALLMALPFLLMAFFFIGVPLLSGTLFTHSVLSVALGFGLPSLLVVWYLLADVFNTRWVVLDGHTLRAFERPIWFFSRRAVRLPLSEVQNLTVAQYAYSPLDALLTGHWFLLGQSTTWIEVHPRRGRPRRLLTQLSSNDAELLVEIMAARLPPSPTIS